MSCWQWAKVFGETGLCDSRDKAGFIIGLFSILCWGLAEVPQLVANAAEGSSEGISEGLLWLWVFSDVLDVAGCSFADTLPTMLITAWMYLGFTVLLLLQHIYYTRIRAAPAAASTCKPGDDLEAPLLRFPRSGSSSSSADEPDLVAELFGAAPQLPWAATAASHTMYGSLRNLSIRRTSSSSSLSLSDTGRRLSTSFSGYRPRAWARRRAGSRHRLAAAAAASSSPGRPSTADAAAGSGGGAAVLPGSLPGSFSSAAAASRLLGGLALLALAVGSGGWLGGDAAGARSAPGRQLLQGEPAAAEQQLWGISYATWGAAMGWLMAASFFLGRLPQVVKNWRRQSCGGLSMEMFAIVLTAAATYCASILIRARSWGELQPKLPFLTDAAVGALLDLVILAQFFIYRNADDAAADPAQCSSGDGRGGGDEPQSKASPLPRIPCFDGTLSSGGSSGKLDVKQQQPASASDLPGSPDADGMPLAGHTGPVPVPVHSSSVGVLSLAGLAGPAAAAAAAAAAGAAVPGSPSVVGLAALLDAPADVLLLHEEGGGAPGSELDGAQACSWTDSLISIATI
uniref:Uncharacterized protein n=1 Tax=Tetradesmus obliquus TaxID=3088 RepID=A0A383VET2_TETOB|eukprot:jgi/Sobl393_1/17789/SZX64065.1